RAPPHCIHPQALLLLAGVGERSACQKILAPCQMHVEGFCKTDGVIITDRSLHGDDGRDSAAQQRLGEASSLFWRNAAVAGIEQYQWQGALHLANGGQQLGCTCTECAALFVLKFQCARQTVARQMKHMVGVALDRAADDLGMSDFKDSDLAVLKMPSRL